MRNYPRNPLRPLKNPEEMSLDELIKTQGKEIVLLSDFFYSVDSNDTQYIDERILKKENNEKRREN